MCVCVCVCVCVVYRMYLCIVGLFVAVHMMYIRIWMTGILCIDLCLECDPAEES